MADQMTIGTLQALIWGTGLVMTLLGAYGVFTGVYAALWLYWPGENNANQSIGTARYLGDCDRPPVRVRVGRDHDERHGHKEGTGGLWQDAAGPGGDGRD
jgi:hypothetical protein